MTCYFANGFACTTFTKTSKLQSRLSGSPARLGLPNNATPISIPNSINQSNGKLQEVKVNNNGLVSCTWNIRTGLITKEQELTDILKTEKVDIIFLAETDTRMLINESSYIISGYKTMLPVKAAKSELVRILGLIKESITPYFKH